MMITRSHGMVVVLILLTLAFFATIPVFGVSTQGPGRVPLGNDPDPPDEVICPSVFTDKYCNGSGFGMDTLYSQALGEATLECSTKYTGCKNSQLDEYLDNKRKCEAVPGCILVAHTSDNQCDPSPESCNPGPSEIVQPGTLFRCNVTESYDIENYFCFYFTIPNINI